MIATCSFLIMFLNGWEVMRGFLILPHHFPPNLPQLWICVIGCVASLELNKETLDYNRGQSLKLQKPLNSFNYQMMLHKEINNNVRVC